jgi:hypothetical protein
MQLFRKSRFNLQFYKWAVVLETERMFLADSITNLLTELVDDAEIVLAMVRDQKIRIGQIMGLQKACESTSEKATLRTWAI